MTKKAKDHDRALAMAKTNDLGMAEAEAEMDGDANMEDAEEAATEALGSKVVVIHIGSQNLRVGLSSDALPKTIPMVIARKSPTNESEDQEEPCPKRLKLDDGTELEPERKFGPDVCTIHFLLRVGSGSNCYSSLHNIQPWPPTSKRTCARISDGHCRIPKKW